MNALRINKEKIYFLMAIASLCACGPRVLVIKQSATSPTFSVIPSSLEESEVALAMKVEKELLYLGLKVVERPPFKFMELKQDASSNPQKTAIKHESTIDIIAVYADSHADYLAVTYRSTQQVRIINKKDLSLVAMVDVGLDQKSNLFNALMYAGLTKEKIDESWCKYRMRPR